jgi:hypothetical protein
MTKERGVGDVAGCRTLVATAKTKSGGELHDIERIVDDTC